MSLNEMEIVGVTSGMGALNMAKKLRRVNEAEGRVAVGPKKDWIAGEEEAQVSRVTKYFDEVVPTEVIDGRPK